MNLRSLSEKLLYLSISKVFSLTGMSVISWWKKMECSRCTIDHCLEKLLCAQTTTCRFPPYEEQLGTIYSLCERPCFYTHRVWLGGSKTNLSNYWTIRSNSGVYMLQRHHTNILARGWTIHVKVRKRGGFSPGQYPHCSHHDGAASNKRSTPNYGVNTSQKEK